MSPRMPLLLAAALVCVVCADARSQTPCPPGWIPSFALNPSAPAVAVGATFTVDLAVSGIQSSVDGWESDIYYDASVVTPVSATQGPYLPFNTFLQSLFVYPGKVRLGALNFPVGSPPVVPPPPPVGSGQGVLATVTFQVIAAGPIHLDLDSFTDVVPSGFCGTIAGPRTDAVLQGLGAGDFLGISGNPDLGGAVFLDRYITSPVFPGTAWFTGASLGNTPGIPVTGVGVIPLNNDVALQLSAQGAAPFANTLGVVGNGVRTIFNIPALPFLQGVRIYFATILISPFGSQISAISNSTHVRILAP